MALCLRLEVDPITQKRCALESLRRGAEQKPPAASSASHCSTTDEVRNIPYSPAIRTGCPLYAAIHEIATLTSKGQVTLPKSVRQLLGLDTGGKIAFDVRGGEVVVSRVEAAHEDPAIGAFLSLLEADIRAGRNLRTLSPDLAEVLLV